MALRNKSYNMYKNSYGTSESVNSLKDPVKLNSKILSPRKFKDPNAVHAETANAYRDISNKSKDLTDSYNESLKKPDFDYASSTTNSASKGLGLSKTLSASKAKGGSGMSKGGGAAAGAATAAAGIAGDYYSNNEKEDVGGALSGAATGASMGSAVGPYGTAAGALIGGAAGWMMGKSKKERREKYQAKAKARYEKRLLRYKDKQRKIVGHGLEARKAAGVNIAASKFDENGRRTFS